MESADALAETSHFNMCDAAAMACFLEPEHITQQHHLYCAVELHGSLSRGATLFDWGKLLPACKPNCHLLASFDKSQFERLWLALLNLDL